MDLQEAEKRAVALMAEHGLLQSGWAFMWDNAKRRFGQCLQGKRVISLSGVLTPLRDEAHVVDTILHEIAHALVGTGHGHDKVWRQKALEIGSNGKRLGGPSGLTGKWIGTCPNGHTYHRHRAPVADSACGHCSKKYDPAYKLTWVKNE